MKDNKTNIPEFRKLQEKLRPFTKDIERNPLMLVCKLHKTTKEEVIKLRKEKSWRGLARVTSQGKCSNQICGWFLCINAGIDKGPWEDNSV